MAGNAVVPKPDPDTTLNTSVDRRVRATGDNILARAAFVTQVHKEKRRSDRSRTPLSLVVVRFSSDRAMDRDDFREILTGLSLSTRETDMICHVNDGQIALLLPYTDANAARSFCRLLVERIQAPEMKLDAASYPDPGFDALLGEVLADSESHSDLGLHAIRGLRFGLAVKRLMDIVGSIVLLLLASPLMLAIAIAVKLSSPGPILFRQTRVGRGGVPFPFLKFRSMYVDSDDRLHREYVQKLIDGKHNEVNQGDASNPTYKMKADPRITPVGRFIRRTSIDELPQLFNVLTGQMSLVGPRPPIPYEVEKYQSWHMRRVQTMRPGITGLWQVEGRSRTTFDEMVRLDLRYIRNWSIWLDIKILFKTVAVVLRMDGAT